MKSDLYLLSLILTCILMYTDTSPDINRTKIELLPQFLSNLGVIV